MIQRCLGARSEWDARMGVVMAGFSKALLPLIVVVPGIIAFYMFQHQISDGDQAWPFMVKQFLPGGLVGLVLAGLASAIMSTLSTSVNSTSTMFTLDLYQPLIRPGADDRTLFRVGRISSIVIMVLGVILAIFLAAHPTATVFGWIQYTFAYMAPPVAAVFLIGIIWRGATPAAATVTLFLGFLVYLPGVKFWMYPKIAMFQPYDNFMHHAFTVMG